MEGAQNYLLEAVTLVVLSVEDYLPFVIYFVIQKGYRCVGVAVWVIPYLADREEVGLLRHNFI